MSAEAQRFRSFAAGALLLILLAILATLQFRWIGQVSEAELSRLEERLATAATRFSNDVDRELARALFYFQPRTSPRESEPWQRRLPVQWTRWQEEAPFPELVAELYVLRPGESAGLMRLDPDRLQFERVDWPGELEELRHRLVAPSGGQRERFRRIVPLLDSVPALVLPAGGSPFAGGRSGGRRFRPPPWFVVVRFDRTFLARELLSELVARHFSPDAHVLIRHRQGSQPPLYTSEPSLPTESAGDLVVPFLRLRSFAELRIAGAQGAPGDPRIGPQPTPPDLPRPGRPPGAGPAAAREAGSWELVVIHRAGSLEQVVSRARRRNLAIGLGILAVLGASMVQLARSSRRSQRLARQQTAFVAGLTHELHTPLAAIRSAAENLADGVVSDPERVRTYGALIHRHGSRLSGLVDQALAFAGMQAEGQGMAIEPIDLTEVVERSQEVCEPLAAENRATIEVEVEPSLPTVLGNADAIQQAIENLLLNAVKYAGHGGPVSLIARRAATARRVEVRVEDRGPGIPRDELKRLCEPFWRGRAARSTAGTGLGLALVKHTVERHRGTLRIENRPGGGATFIIELPTGEEEEG